MPNTSPKVILLSGGSRGLGLHLVRHLLGAGHIVATFARKRTPAMDELETQYPGAFHFREYDARDDKAIAGYVRELVKLHGRLDALVNNAAIGQDHLLVHMKPDMIHDILSINLEAVILLTRTVVRQMLLQPSGGRIINISSICGSRGFAGLTVYSATKGAMDAFTRSLARELGERKILINSLAPGFFESEMSSVLSADQLSTIKRRTPTLQLTQEEQLTPALDMLLFADTNMTGQVLFVDGGITS